MPLPPDVRLALSARASPVGLTPGILATAGIVFYAAVVPVLEVNATHVFNPAWAPHARLHEVWQLLTNTGLGIFAAWRLWRRRDLPGASVINGLVMLSFLVAYLTRGSCGGSMILEGWGERTVPGMNLAVFGFGLALGCNAAALCLHHGRSRPGT